MRCKRFVLALGFVLLSAPGIQTDDGPHYTVRFLNASRFPQVLQTMVFSPDGSRLAVATQFGRVSFVETNDGELTEDFEFRPEVMRFSRDGTQLLMIGPNQRKMLDLRRWTAVDLSVAEQPGYLGIAFEDKNGKWLINGLMPGSPAALSGGLKVGDEIVAVGQGQEGEFTDVRRYYQDQLLRVLGGPAGTLVRLQVVPHGKLEPEVYSLERYAKRSVGGVERYVPVQRVAAADNLVWYRSKRAYEFCSAATGQLVGMVQPQSVESGGLAALSPDQQRFALIGGTQEGVGVEVYDVPTGKRVLLHDLSNLEAPDAFAGLCQDVAFSADSGQLLIGTWDAIHVLDIASNAVERQIALDEGARKELKPRARGFAAAAIRSRGESQGFGQSSWEWGPRVVEHFAVSPRGVIAAGNPQGQVKLWDFGDGTLLKEFPPAEGKKNVQGVAFSGDGRWLAYYVDGDLHLVDVAEVKVVEASE